MKKVHCFRFVIQNIYITFSTGFLLFCNTKGFFQIHIYSFFGPFADYFTRQEDLYNNGLCALRVLFGAVYVAR